MFVVPGLRRWPFIFILRLRRLAWLVIVIVIVLRVKEGRNDVHLLHRAIEVLQGTLTDHHEQLLPRVKLNIDVTPAPHSGRGPVRPRQPLNNCLCLGPHWTFLGMQVLRREQDACVFCRFCRFSSAHLECQRKLAQDPSVRSTSIRYALRTHNHADATVVLQVSCDQSPYVRDGRVYKLLNRVIPHAAIRGRALPLACYGVAPAGPPAHLSPRCVVTCL